MNIFKATVRKLVDLPWGDFRDLFSWNSNGSPINAENKNLLVAKATNQKGEVVAYVTAENILLVASYVLNPQITPDEAVSAGNSIDIALAQHAGVNRFWIVLPSGAPKMGGERLIRVIERRVSITNKPKAAARDSHIQATYLN